MFALLLLAAALLGAFTVHLFKSIDIAYWQRAAVCLAINDSDPREAIRKLGILSAISFGDHVNLVTTFRDPSRLYAALPAEMERVW